jgi:Holliday junction resolvase RusA-like endonuclease
MDGAPVETVIRIVVPGAPKAWQRAGHRIIAPKGKKAFVSTYTPAQTRSEQDAIKLFASLAMQGRPPLEGPLDLRFAAYFAVPDSWSAKKKAQALEGIIRPTRKPDADNLVKQCDALNGLVFKDDSQITDVAVWKRYSDRPRVVIEIRPIGAGGAA